MTNRPPSGAARCRTRPGGVANPTDPATPPGLGLTGRVADGPGSEPTPAAQRRTGGVADGPGSERAAPLGRGRTGRGSGRAGE